MHGNNFDQKLKGHNMNEDILNKKEATNTLTRGEKAEHMHFKNTVTVKKEQRHNLSFECYQ